MLPKRAEQMLRDYKKRVGRCGFLRKTIAEAEADIAMWEKHLADDMVGGAQNLDGMPHGTTVGNPTERIALKLATGYEPDDLKEARLRLEQMRAELREKEMEVVFVEAWLDGLTDRERWLIERIYFQGYTFNEAAKAYGDAFGIYMSRDGIRRMKRRCVDKIAEMAM